MAGELLHFAVIDGGITGGRHVARAELRRNFGKKNAKSLGELGLSRFLPALSLRLCQGREAGGRRGSPASGGPRDVNGRSAEWEQLVSGTLEKRYRAGVPGAHYNFPPFTTTNLGTYEQVPGTK